MKAHQAEYPIATQCRVLGVSTSGYYAWLKRAPSARSKANAELLEEIKKSHKKSDGTYGAPRIHADLPKEMGASLNRVARVMCDVGIQGVTRRKWTKTTVRDEDERAAPDLVDRDFTATGPDQLWVADITYIPTWAGFLYLAVVMDVWSRRIVGWAMATHLRTELVLDALNMALRQRRPEAVVHHSDQGSQYTSVAFGGRCKEPGRWLNRLRGRGKAAAGAVGSDGIVLAPPLLDQHVRLRQRVEDLPVQQLVPELAVEALVVAVLPRAARLDKERLDAHAPQPPPHELRGELRSVVRPQILGRPVSDEQIGQHLEHIVGADLASHHDRQALPRVLVQHCQ